MNITTAQNTTIIKDVESNIPAFLDKITAAYSSYKNNNLILDLTENDKISISILKSFLPLIKTHSKVKKSLVLVIKEIDFSALPNNIIAVPSIIEAHDIIELDEIQRDLGF